MKTVEVLCFLLSLLIVAGLIYNAYLHGSDFHVFYKAGQRSLQGLSLYQFQDGADPFKYHPIWAYFFSIFNMVPEKVALIFFTLLQLSFWTMGAITLSRWLGYKLKKSSHLLFLLMISLNALSSETGYGQINGFLFAGTLVVIMWLEGVYPRPAYAGFLVSLLVSLKLPFAVLIFYGIIKSRKFLVGLLGGFAMIHAVVAIASHDFLCLEIYKNWFSVLLTQSADQYYTYEVQGFFRFFHAYLGSHDRLFWKISLVLYAMGGFLIHYFKPQRSPAVPAIYWLSGVFFLSPLSWWYQILFIYPMAFYLLKSRIPVWQKALVTLCLLCFAFAAFDVLGRERLIFFKENQGFFYASVLMGALFLKEIFFTATTKPQLQS